jgi:hypothetical protein
VSRKLKARPQKDRGAEDRLPLTRGRGERRYVRIEGEMQAASDATGRRTQKTDKEALASSGKF